MKALLRFLKIVAIVIGIVWSVAALTRLWDVYTVGGVSGFLLHVLSEYELVTESFFRWLEPPFVGTVAYLAQVTGWKLTIVPFWKDIFALLALYFGAQVSDVHERRRYPNPLQAMLGQGTWATLCVFGTTIFSGVSSWNGSGVLIVAVSLAGIVVHRLGFALLWAMNRARHFREPLRSSFMKKASGAVVIAVLGFGICLAGSGLTGLELLGAPIGAPFFVLAAVLLVLAGFHTAPGILEYLGTGRLERHEGSVLIGTKILGTVLLTFCAIVGLS